MHEKPKHPTDSMEDVHRNLRVDWYRSPIDRNSLRTLAKSDDTRGFIQAMGHLGLWIITALLSFYFFKQQQWLGFAVSLFLHGTITSFFGSAHHELCHRTVFKTRWLNEVFLYIFSILAWMNYRVYRFSHNYHHRYTLFLAGDREEIMPETPSLRVLYLLQLFTFNITGGYQSRGVIDVVKNTVDVAMDRFDNPFGLWGKELYAGHDSQRRKAVRCAREILLFHGLVILGSVAIGEPVIALIVSGSAFIAHWHRYFVGVPMHCGLRSNVSDFRKCARSITLDPLSAFLFWHMNWHLEHHMYAAVPCYNLKKLHKELANDMPKPRTLIGAWQEMRDTWRRQQIDPDYAFDTPVPKPRNTKSGKQDPLADSLGDLATRELAE